MAKAGGQASRVYDAIRQAKFKIVADYAYAPTSEVLPRIFTELGLDVVPFGQGYGSMSAPAKELESLVLLGKIRHGNNPILKWCVGNCIVEEDAAGNIKPSKARSTERIDGVIGLVEALGVAMIEPERHVRLFRNGRNQALRIPREFELEGDEAILRKEGDRLVIEPVRKGRLLALLATLDPIETRFPDVDGDLAPLEDVEL